jgi:hypothetical protein
LVRSEIKKLLEEASVTTIKSKARAPKRKEEYVPPDEIKKFCKEMLKAGRHLASVSSVCFPDTEWVSRAIEKVLNVVKDFKLVERWITSRVSNTEEGYATTEEICQVNFCVFSLLINAMHNF